MSAGIISKLQSYDCRLYYVSPHDGGGGGELTGSQEIYFDYMILFYISITW